MLLHKKEQKGTYMQLALNFMKEKKTEQKLNQKKMIVKNNLYF